jgi:hypothetical protein
MDAERRRRREGERVKVRNGMEERTKKAWDKQRELWDEEEIVKVKMENDTVEMRRN